MEFKKAIKIDEILKSSEVLKDGARNHYLLEESLPQLSQANRFNVLYFRRSACYTIIPDFPCQGAEEAFLSSSALEGPMETPPSLPERNSGGGISSDQRYTSLVRFFPVTEEIPSFQDVTVQRYGTRMNPRVYSYISHRVNKDRLLEISEQAWKILEKLGTDIKISTEGPNEYHYTYHMMEASVEQFRVGLTCVAGSFYPLVAATIFGPGRSASGITRALGLQNLPSAISDREVGIEDTIQRGYAYNLPPWKELDLRGKKIEELENIII